MTQNVPGDLNLVTGEHILVGLLLRTSLILGDVGHFLSSSKMFALLFALNCDCFSVSQVLCISYTVNLSLKKSQKINCKGPTVLKKVPESTSIHYESWIRF